MKNQLTSMLIMLGILFFTSCKKEEKEEKTATPTPSKSFLNITFSPKNAFFSTDGSMLAPVDSVEAKTITSKIDITFIYNSDYSEPGFLDPITRSKVWSWNEYFKSWLNKGVETKYYSTNLKKTDFDAARIDQTKIATYFSSSTTELAPHAIFPTGSCVGGRESSDPTSVTLSKDQVIGFKNTASGKRGLIYIRLDQSQLWPTSFFNTNTKVDILREE